MIAQHYQQASPIEELADQLVKQGIASTKLDAKKMAENMLNKQMHEARSEQPVQTRQQPKPTVVLTQPSQSSLDNSPIHPQVKQHITHLHTRIDEQHKLIDELKSEILALKTKVDDHEQKLHKEQNDEMATEIVEEPINYNGEHVDEEKESSVQQEVANEILEVETLTAKDKAEIAEAEEELSIIPEKKKDDDVDLLNIF